jgi:hypothetical protein
MALEVLRETERSVGGKIFLFSVLMGHMSYESWKREDVDESHVGKNMWETC